MLAHPLGPTKRIVGIVIALLSATLIVSPIPFSNIVPALVVAPISIACGGKRCLAIGRFVVCRDHAGRGDNDGVGAGRFGAKWIVGLW